MAPKEGMSGANAVARLAEVLVYPRANGITFVRFIVNSVASSSPSPCQPLHKATTVLLSFCLRSLKGMHERSGGLPDLQPHLPTPPPPPPPRNPSHPTLARFVNSTDWSFNLLTIYYQETLHKCET